MAKFCFSVILAVGMFLLMQACARMPETVPVRVEVVKRAAYDFGKIEREVHFWESVVARDPAGSIGWAKLAHATLQLAKKTQQGDDALQAELAARKSLELRSAGNAEATHVLIQAMLEQHQFRNANAEVMSALKSDPNNALLKLLQIDILIELGKYAEAKELSVQSPRLFEGMKGSAVANRLYELGNDRELASSRWKAAADEADADSNVGHESAAWYQIQAADCCYRLGELQEAKMRYERACELYPDGYRAFLGLARLALYEGRLTDALNFSKKVERMVPLLDPLAIQLECAHETKDSAGFERIWKKIRQRHLQDSSEKHTHGDMTHSHGNSPGGHGHTHGRQYAQICADWGRDLVVAKQLAESDFAERQDAGAYDLLAWIAFRNGELEQASQLIQSAISNGKFDPRIMFHSAVIAAHTGVKHNSETLYGLTPREKRCLDLCAQAKLTESLSALNR